MTAGTDTIAALKSQLQLPGREKTKCHDGGGYGPEPRPGDLGRTPCIRIYERQILGALRLRAEAHRKGQNVDALRSG